MCKYSYVSYKRQWEEGENILEKNCSLYLQLWVKLCERPPGLMTPVYQLTWRAGGKAQNRRNWPNHGKSKHPILNLPISMRCILLCHCVLNDSCQQPGSTICACVPCIRVPLPVLWQFCSQFQNAMLSVCTGARAWLNDIFVGSTLSTELKCTWEGLFLKAGGGLFIFRIYNDSKARRQTPDCWLGNASSAFMLGRLPRP